jgi:hypothetical protein
VTTSTRSSANGNGVWDILSRGGVETDRRIEADVQEEPIPGDLAIGNAEEAEGVTEHLLARGGNADKFGDWGSFARPLSHDVIVVGQNLPDGDSTVGQGGEETRDAIQP